MDRKEFLKTCFLAGACGCAAAFGIGRGSAAGAGATDASGLGVDLHRRMREGSRTPDWARMEKAETWIKSLMDNMDALLDEQTKIQLMHACGRSCYFNAFGVPDAEKPSPEVAEQALQGLEKAGFRVERGSETTTITYGWGGQAESPGSQHEGRILYVSACRKPNPRAVPNLLQLLGRLCEGRDGAGHRKEGEIGRNPGDRETRRKRLPLQDRIDEYMNVRIPNMPELIQP
jgi:hypothetical protein